MDAGRQEAPVPHRRSRRGQPPSPPAAPPGPNIQESFGKSAPARTHQDLLRTSTTTPCSSITSPRSWCSSIPLTGKRRVWPNPACTRPPIPPPAGRISSWPASRNHSPACSRSRGSPAKSPSGSPRVSPVFKVADLPSHEGVPIEGVLTGPRNVHWRPTADATLVWAEALDGGDPKNKVPHRDKLMALRGALQAPAKEVLRLEHRFSGLTLGGADRHGFRLRL